MTYDTCKKAINAKKVKLTDKDLDIYVADMARKLDVFQLNNRLSKEQYNELVNMLI